MFSQRSHKSFSVLKSLLSFGGRAANQWTKKDCKLQEGVRIAVTSGFVSQESKNASKHEQNAEL